MVRHPAGSGLGSGFRASTSASGAGMATGAEETRTVKELKTRTKREAQRILIVKMCEVLSSKEKLFCERKVRRRRQRRNCSLLDTRGGCILYNIRTPGLVKGNTISRRVKDASIWS